MGYGLVGLPGARRVQITGNRALIYAAQALVVAGKVREIRRSGRPLTAQATPPAITPPIIPPAPPRVCSNSAPRSAGRGLARSAQAPQRFPDPSPTAVARGGQAGYR
jgi:hypothetical protein